MEGQVLQVEDDELIRLMMMQCADEGAGVGGNCSHREGVLSAHSKQHTCSENIIYEVRL